MANRVWCRGGSKGVAARRRLQLRRYIQRRRLLPRLLNKSPVMMTPATRPLNLMSCKNGSKTVKQESSSDEDSSEDESDDDSDDKPAAPLKKTSVAVAQKKKGDSSKSDFDDDSNEDASKTQPAKSAASKMKDEPSDDSDTDDDEEPPQKKQKESLSTAKKESTSEDEDDSCEESSDDEPTEVEEKKTRVIKIVKSLLILQRRLQCTPLKSKLLPKKKEFFEDVGEVVDVRFPTHDDGSRKRFWYVEFVSAEATVEFVSAEAAAKAYKLKQSKELHGREVRLDFAKGRSTQTPRSGNDGSFQKTARGNNSSIFIRGFDKKIFQRMRYW
ncbi:Nucleolin 1 [Zea mays]|uniref:Nucleolin 1 n=1 Tax=Zea mays TaxID=4577 RepID=A0A3L6DXV0_MAIZE|nr:Nucleolin 1 [Zea mays]